MWIRSENGEPIKPLPIEASGSNVILRRNYTRVVATEEMPEHWTYDEWQMTAEQYEIYQNFEQAINEQSDALIELADIIAEIGG